MCLKGNLRERIELDLVAWANGRSLILNRSLDPLYGDYIELNDLNEPLELRRNQVDDLEPTIEEGEVIDEPMIDRVETRSNNKIVDGLDEYPGYCDFDRKIHIYYAFNLQFSCMIDFAVVENIDSYRDEGMGDIIVGRPFCKEARIKANRISDHVDGIPGGRSTAAARGGRTGGRTGRGGGKTGRPIGRVGGRTGDQDGQGGGCSYKEFLACNPKEYDGKGGAIVYTRWIEKMELVQNMSGCGDNQKVKYTFSSFIDPGIISLAWPRGIKQLVDLVYELLAYTRLLPHDWQI
ncbi:hypothetical protein Tco_0867246 [Tanacetum coccineum]